MHGELVKELRDSAEWADRLALLMGRAEGDTHAPIMRNAADAIEELSHVAEVNAKRALKWASDAEKAEKKLRWIPVTERLPEHLTSVIVHRKDGGIFIWEYFDTSPTDECWIDDSMNVYSFYDVTHWMPLPEPPKEK